jgi:hypothetical protein
MTDDVSSVVAAVATTATSGANIRAGAVVRYVRTGRVSARYFDVLALHPILGRPDAIGQAVALTLAAVILLATTPVLKIARIDPARALRED